MSIEIESGIPIPDKRIGQLKQALKGMKVGDSFILPKARRSSISSNAARYGVKVVTRLVDNGLNVRTWRVG